ncbi:MAG: Gfo/Idh/MocA family protein, partial [Chloroflexota bacterium]
MATYKIAGINFDHQHMGDNLRMAHEHPEVEIVGICDEDPARTARTASTLGIPPERIFTDYR